MGRSYHVVVEREVEEVGKLVEDVLGDGLQIAAIEEEAFSPSLLAFVYALRRTIAHLARGPRERRKRHRSRTSPSPPPFPQYTLRKPCWASLHHCSAGASVIVFMQRRCACWCGCKVHGTAGTLVKRGLLDGHMIVSPYCCHAGSAVPNKLMCFVGCQKRIRYEVLARMGAVAVTFATREGNKSQLG